MLQHNAADTLASTAASFGDYVSCQVYYSRSLATTASTPAPAVIWLHPYAYNTGYAPAYLQARVFEDLAHAGFVVMAYEQIGFGLRNTQGGNRFYRRHGDTSSILGHMVKDTRAAVDFLYCRSPEGK